MFPGIKWWISDISKNPWQQNQVLSFSTNSLTPWEYSDCSFNSSQIPSNVFFCQVFLTMHQAINIVSARNIHEKPEIFIHFQQILSALKILLSQFQFLAKSCQFLQSSYISVWLCIKSSEAFNFVSSRNTHQKPGHFYSFLTNTFGLENILMAVSTSCNFFSKNSFRCLTLNVSLLTGNDCNSRSISPCATKMNNSKLAISWLVIEKICTI